MNDLETYNYSIELVDNLTLYANQIENDELLNIATNLGNDINSATELDAELLIDIAAGIESAANVLFDYMPDTALNLLETSSLFESRGYELNDLQERLSDAYDSDSEESADLIDEILSEQEELLEEIEHQSTGLSSEFDDYDDEPDDLAAREPSDWRVAEEHGFEIMNQMLEGYTIRRSSGSTNIEDAISYIKSIGIDGIAEIYYDMDDDLYYVQVLEESV